MNERKIVNRLSFVGITGNVILSAFKLFAGIMGHSSAMISDAIHSLSDVFATMIALVGVKISGKEADQDHPYGHERFECVAAMCLSLVLAVTGLGIGWSGIQKIMAGNYSSIAVPTLLPLAAAVISIVVKECMFHYTMHYAKILNSDAFKADAWHHRSDAMSSIGSFIGILAARLGFPIMDPVTSIFICLFILKAAFDILKDALDKMLDKSCSKEFENQLSDYITSQPGVQGIDLLQTRQFGNKVYVDVEISVQKDTSLVKAHDIAEDVHNGIENLHENVKHVMVHVNPGL